MTSMQNLPDLSELSLGQKDELIRTLQKQLQDLLTQMVVMHEYIKQLEARLTAISSKAR